MSIFICPKLLVLKIKAAPPLKPSLMSPTPKLLAHVSLPPLFRFSGTRVHIHLWDCVLLWGTPRPSQCFMCGRQSVQCGVLQDGGFLAHIHHLVAPENGCEDKFNFETSNRLFLCFLPPFLRLPEGRFGWYLKAPAAFFISFSKQPKSFSNAPTRSLRYQIRNLSKELTNA